MRTVFLGYPLGAQRIKVHKHDTRFGTSGKLFDSVSTGQPQKSHEIIMKSIGAPLEISCLEPKNSALTSTPAVELASQGFQPVMEFLLLGGESLKSWCNKDNG